MQLSTLFTTALMAAFSTAQPASNPAQSFIGKPFTSKAVAPGSQVDGLALNANGGRIVLGGEPSGFCPGHIACPPGDVTAFVVEGDKMAHLVSLLDHISDGKTNIEHSSSQVTHAHNMPRRTSPSLAANPSISPPTASCPIRPPNNPTPPPVGFHATPFSLTFSAAENTISSGTHWHFGDNAAFPWKACRSGFEWVVYASTGGSAACEAFTATVVSYTGGLNGKSAYEYQ